MKTQEGQICVIDEADFYKWQVNHHYASSDRTQCFQQQTGSGSDSCPGSENFNLHMSANLQEIRQINFLERNFKRQIFDV